ncbi:peptide chain release factor N(5)-glutamine methyltransferase [Spongiibacter taiwanensis]|uniref:peptide chain release factor N(5)-glutamine methyltransferase n=1 Tax=Spongiibacter taiwanensis TaxID=1748242 RepID=UPI002034D865|nr:peptide chain release factor N(5)-glutamine methyltransferase [Spongiibacter taiwanensis]USA44334.1 peptide chain release factor N(5)-glutamine methyltransferase [Spongiibacter taiwanensis]
MSNASSLTIHSALACQQQLADVSDSPLVDVALLLCHCLDKPRSYLYTWPEKLLTEDQQSAFYAMLARRKTGEPVAHILGQREFWSLPLKVSPVSLIPRPDTETLVEQALAWAGERPSGRILDLGTGTGAIALALACELPDWSVLGCDRVPEAVALAEENRQTLELENVQFVQSHWFSAVTGPFDLVVSNPPYIEADDPHLEQGDVRFEPRSALVAGADGLDDIRQIIAEAPGVLVPGGVLMLEHGFAQGAAVAALLAQHGYVDLGCCQDIAGHDRVSWGVWPNE